MTKKVFDDIHKLNWLTFCKVEFITGFSEWKDQYDNPVKSDIKWQLLWKITSN